MTEFGLRFVDKCSGSDGRDQSVWWDRVADQMESVVSLHLPPGARSVEMALGTAIDSDRLEVVLEYDAPGRDRLSVCR